jgi:hypothetical protein
MSVQSALIKTQLLPLSTRTTSVTTVTVQVQQHNHHFYEDEEHREGKRKQRQWMPHEPGADYPGSMSILT